MRRDAFTENHRAASTQQWIFRTWLPIQGTILLIILLSVCFFFFFKGFWRLCVYTLAWLLYFLARAPLCYCFLKVAINSSKKNLATKLSITIRMFKPLKVWSKYSYKLLKSVIWVIHALGKLVFYFRRVFPKSGMFEL